MRRAAVVAVALCLALVAGAAGPVAEAPLAAAGGAAVTSPAETPQSNADAESSPEPDADPSLGADGESSPEPDAESSREADATRLAATGPSSLRSASIPQGESAGALQTDGPSIRLERELQRRPDRRGDVAVRHRYELPDSVVELSVELPSTATVVDRSGFAPDEGGRFVWDGETATPTLTYRTSVNETADRGGPIAGPGQFLFVDAADWSLVRVPGAGHGWSWRGGDPVGFERTTTVDGAGAAGDLVAFLGPHEEYRRDAHGQTFRLIVPAAADLAAPPEAILDELARASDALRVGDRDDEVFLVAAPTGGVDWGVRGLQTGDADGWVRASEPLDDVESVWLHEYVHTRQAWTSTPDARWITEASATYYAALLALSGGRADFGSFRQRLAAGEDDRYADTRLADPSAWTGAPDYDLGALVAGALDRRIRLATDGTRSLQDVFGRANARTDPLSAAALVDLLGGLAGDAVAADGDRWTTTTDHPEAWDDEAHAEAFGTDPARITYAVDGDLGVTGPYRNGTLAADRPVVVPGERLTLSIRIRNAGGSAGPYDATLSVDGTDREARTGRLGPDEAATFTYEVGVTSRGVRTLTVGEATVTVEARRPATATVRGLSADRRRVAVGDAVRLSIDVVNSAARPGAVDVPVLVDGERVTTRTVRLAPGAERAVVVERRFETAGERVVTLGDGIGGRVVVAVASPTETGADADGFGAVAALAALAALALIARRV